MRARGSFILILVASIIVVGSALASEYWGGLVPCELCLIERDPYYIAIIVALVGVALPRLRSLLLLLLLIYLVSAGLGFYHVGVEQHWFQGPTACTSTGTVPKTLEEMRALLAKTQAVMCDQVQWSLAGISLAGWNCFASLAIASFAYIGWRRRG